MGIVRILKEDGSQTTVLHLSIMDGEKPLGGESKQKIKRKGKEMKRKVGRELQC